MIQFRHSSPSPASPWPAAWLREGPWGPHLHLLWGARFLSTVNPEKGVNLPHIQELGSCAKGPEKCMIWPPSTSPKAPPRLRTFPPSRRFHPLFQVLFLLPMDQSELSKFQTLAQLGGFRECLCGAVSSLKGWAFIFSLEGILGLIGGVSAPTML